MGNYNRPIPIKCWEAFLIYSQCEFKSNNGSHHKWKCPGCLRSVIFHGHKKEVPRFHINTCLATMGVSKNEFNNWSDKNC